MPKKKNQISADQQRKQFEEEIRGREEAGDFDRDAAEAALDHLVRGAAKRSGK